MNQKQFEHFLLVVLLYEQYIKEDVLFYISKLIIISQNRSLLYF